MAAGSEVPQKGVLQATGFTPSEYRATPINVPSDAGRLWAGVGATALSAAQQVGTMLQQSPLNPVVAAQMKEAQARAGLGTKVIQHAAANPKWAYATTSEGPQGAGMVAPITQPVAQQTAEGIDLSGNPPPPPEQPAQPATITRTGKNTGVDESGNPYYETKPGSNQWTAGKPMPAAPTNLNQGMAQGGLVRGYAAGGTVDTDSVEARLHRMEQERQAAGLSTGAGAAPPGMFLNPATGSYEPLQQAPPSAQPAAPPAAQPAQPQSPSIWSPQRPSPAAPPAPTAPSPQGQPSTLNTQYAPSSTPGTAPGSLSDQYAQGAQAQPSTPGTAPGSMSDQYAQQQNLAQWQAQSMGLPMTAQDAMDWMGQRTTMATGVTYMANGGPGGSPAFAFHMKTPGGKGGGINIVPVSQMVQNGAGPSVAAQNTSMMLSQTDKLQQGQQNALVAPPGQPPQQQTPPNISPPPPANLPQQPGGPPPAPGASMPSGTGAGAPQPVSATPGPPPAPGPTSMPSGTGAGAPQPVSATPTSPGAYNAAAYQMPQGPTVTQNGQVNPALMAGGDNRQAVEAAKPDAVAKGMGTPVSGPDPAMESKIFNWQVDADDPNHPYAQFKDSQHPFWQNRYYQGIGMLNGPFTAENQRKQQLLEEFTGPAGVPLPKGPDGKPQLIDEKMIASSSPQQQAEWLNYARDFKFHTKAPLGTDSEGIALANNANALQDAIRIRDKIQYLKDNHIPMDVISQDEFVRSREAGYSEGAHSPGEKAMWGYWAAGAPKNNFADELNADYQKLNQHLAGVPQGTYANAKTPEPELWDWEAPIPFGGGQKMGVKLPKTTDVSTIPALNKIGSGDTHDQALAHIQEVIDKVTADYKNEASKLYAAGNRVPDVDQKNLYDLDNKGKGYLDDPTNTLWDKNHQKMSNPYGVIPRTQGMFNYETYGDGGKLSSGSPVGGLLGNPSASPTPVPKEVAAAAPRPKTKADFDAIKPGTLYWDGDGQLKPK